MRPSCTPMAMLLALALAACDGGWPAGGGAPGLAEVAVRVAAPPAYASAPGLAVERLRLSLLRINQLIDAYDTVASRTASFGPDRDAISLSLSVFLSQPETLIVDLQYQTAAGLPLFVASGSVVAVPGSPTSSPIVQPFYIGPGSNVAVLNLSPLDTTITSGDTLAYDVTALDANQASVPQFYVHWQTDDARVSINALGVVRAPDITRQVTVVATTPNGTQASTSLVIQGSAGLGLSPDSVEVSIFSGVSFGVAIGGLRTSVYAWSVEGVDGGDGVVGSVDSAGFYSAPGALPATNPVQVCARDTTRTGFQGCATVVLTDAVGARR